ncbi:MAG: hypothetical protein ACYDDF_12545 [Thermoplasmatota archaeon]
MPAFDPTAPGNAALILTIVGILVMISLAATAQARRREPTPLETLARNLRASALPIPAKSVALTGAAHVPGARLGRALGVVAGPHLVMVILRPTMARAGLLPWLRGDRHVIMAGRHDVGDLFGKTLILRGTMVLRQAHDFYWLFPDLLDAETRARWRATLGWTPSRVRDGATRHSPREADRDATLLTAIQEYYRDAVEMHLATQEEVEHLDLNARARRAIPLETQAFTGIEDPSHDGRAGPRGKPERPHDPATEAPEA